MSSTSISIKRVMIRVMDVLLWSWPVVMRAAYLMSINT